MAEHRVTIRIQGYAKVLNDLHPGYLRDLTVDGCKIVTLTPMENAGKESTKLDIYPEETSRVGPIEVEGILCWSREEPPYFVYGFQLIHFASDSDRENYKKLVEQFSRFS